MHACGVNRVRSSMTAGLDAPGDECRGSCGSPVSRQAAAPRAAPASRRPELVEHRDRRRMQPARIAVDHFERDAPAPAAHADRLHAFGADLGHPVAAAGRASGVKIVAPLAGHHFSGAPSCAAGESRRRAYRSADRPRSRRQPRVRDRPSGRAARHSWAPSNRRSRRPVSPRRPPVRCATALANRLLQRMVERQVGLDRQHAQWPAVGEHPGVLA